MGNDERLNPLLKPSLSDDDSLAEPPYTVQATFFTAFFGGPVAALLMWGTNSYRLTRIVKDLPFIGLGIAIFLASFWAIFLDGIPGSQDWLVATLGERGVQFFFRFEALILAGGGYLNHRREQRTADLMGAERPNGWTGGLACVIAGAVILAAAASLFSTAP